MFKAADDAAMMKKQMGAGPQTPEMYKVFAAERDNLALASYDSALRVAADERLLRRINK